jgi:pimeloyl-ACP methyl ester carboxylesterase
MGEVQLIQAGPVRPAYRESGAASAAPVVLLPAGHLVHARQPEAFVYAVADFLAEDPNR